MQVSYCFPARQAGIFTTGLSPKFTTRHKTDGTDMLAFAPAIREVGGGWYSLSWDSSLGGDVVGVIDSGSPLVDPRDRYLPFTANLLDGIP